MERKSTLFRLPVVVSERLTEMASKKFVSRTAILIQLINERWEQEIGRSLPKPTQAQAYREAQARERALNRRLEPGTGRGVGFGGWVASVYNGECSYQMSKGITCYDDPRRIIGAYHDIGRPVVTERDMREWISHNPPPDEVFGDDYDWPVIG